MNKWTGNNVSLALCCCGKVLIGGNSVVFAAVPVQTRFLESSGQDLAISCTTKTVFVVHDFKVLTNVAELEDSISVTVRGPSTLTMT